MQLLHNTEINHRRLAVAMAAMWRDVLGVETEILNQEWQVFLQTRRTKIDTQVFRYGWIGDYNDPYTFAEILESKHGLNDMAYNNPRYDAAAAAGLPGGGPGGAHGAAGRGRAHHAGRHADPADLLLREQADGETLGGGLRRATSWTTTTAATSAS